MAASKTFRNTGLGAAVLLAVILGVLALTPVPRPTDENTYIVSGQVAAVASPCCEDVTFTLHDDDRVYYVNRGLERGLTLGTLNQRFQGRTVRLHVIRRRWTPLDPFQRMAPVAQVTLDDEVVFTSFKQAEDMLP